MVEEFIGKFFDLYYKHCAEIPLQLILFTHDELIFDCILNKLISKELIDKTIFGRLMSYNDSFEMEDFKELLYKIPDGIPNLINKNIAKVDDAISISKDEISMDISRMSIWVTIVLAAVGFLGIFFPILLNFYSTRDLEKRIVNIESALDAAIKVLHVTEESK